MSLLEIPEIAILRFWLIWTLFIVLFIKNREDEQVLIQQAKKGDQRAFEKLVMMYQKNVYHLARRIVLNHMDADEVVQNTFLKVYKNLGDYDSTKCKFFTWLYRITINTALSFVRNRPGKDQSIDSLMDEDGVQFANEEDSLQEYQNQELQKVVQKALENLSPDIRSVFILRTWNDMSYKEISEALQISEGTVMSRLNRARSKLQAILKETGGYR